MDFEYDLFISYKSEDRPWAARFYADLRRSYPLLRVFWDRTGIPAGDPFRVVLDTAIPKSAHCVLFWSDAVAASSEVVDEFKGFQADVKRQPNADAGARRLFYVPLQGKYDPLEGTQGFAELRKLAVYDSGAALRGTERLGDEQVRLEWNRMLRQIADLCLASYSTQPVTLAILVMNASLADNLDSEYMIDGLVPGPSLKTLLLKLDPDPPAVPANATPQQRAAIEDARARERLDDLKTRYGSTALDWRPFGMQGTVIDYMEGLRTDTNKRLLPEYRFHWEPKDLYAELTREGITLEEYTAILEALAGTPSAGGPELPPSVVVVDQCSLYNLRVYMVFNALSEYAKKAQNVIISFAPTYTTATDVAVNSIRGRADTILKGFFEPQIPGAGTFASCAFNVQTTVEAKRVIRSGLGLFYQQKKSRQGNAVTQGDGR